MAVACMIVGLWAPTAQADEPATLEPAPPADATPASGTTSTAETTPPVAETQVVSSPAASDGSGSGGSELGGGGTEPPPGGPLDAPPPDQRPQDSAAEGETRIGDSAPRGAGSASGGPQRASEANAQRVAGAAAGASVMPAVPAAAPPSAAVATGPVPASGSELISDLLPVALGGGGPGSGLAAMDTGGTGLLLASSVACHVIHCFGQAGAVIGSAPLAARLRGQTAAGKTNPDRSDLSALITPGPSGPHDGAFFSLSGGSGGTGVGFTLLTLVALLAAWLVRQRDWTTALRALPAVFPPSAYVPPLESPG